MEEEEEDLTRDMEDPAPEPAVTEVTTGSKIQPSKGGNYMDLDDEGGEKAEKTEGPVSKDETYGLFLIDELVLDESSCLRAKLSLNDHGKGDT